MSQPILSICISTYNRECSLRQLLENIYSQRGFCIDELEICIVNDPSNNLDDHTSQMIAGFQGRYKNLSFYKNPSRIGMIPSIFQVAKMWKGDYIWIFSDDDVMHPDAIGIMINTIKNHSPSLILNKFLWFEWEIAPFDNHAALHWSTIVVNWIEELFNYFAKINYSIDGFMMHCSLFCFQRELFHENVKILLTRNGDNYINTLQADYFWHVRTIYLPFGNTHKIVLLEKNLVLLRGWNISWSFVFKVCTDFHDLIKDLKNQYSINSIAFRKMKILYYYSVFTYFVIVYVQKYIPKKIYNILVEWWKKIVRIIRIG